MTIVQKTSLQRRFKRWGLGSYRLGLILVSIISLKAIPVSEKSLDPQQVLELAKKIIPEVHAVGDVIDGFFPLIDEYETLIGWATSTFPHARNIQGYSGASEAFIVLDSERKIQKVQLLSSEDTDGHVRKVRDDSTFWQQWQQRTEASLGSISGPIFVSGATLTSEAIVRGVSARFGAKGMEEWFPEPIHPQDYQSFFPKAERLEETEVPGIYEAFQGDKVIGKILRSSKMGVSARGYNGISDVLVFLMPDQPKILGIHMLGSRDNEPYISNVKQEIKYADGFKGKSFDEVLAEPDLYNPLLLTSGASYTTNAVVESVREMIRRYSIAEAKPFIPWKTLAALLWIALGVFVCFHKSGNKPYMRYGFAIISVGAGIGLGWMLSQDQLIGWGKNGFSMQNALPLIVLSTVALVTPAFFGKNVYCHRICPHGAAQMLGNRMVKKRFSLAPKIHSFLVRLPWLTLVTIWLLAIVASGIPFAYFEPFETWSSGFIAFIPSTIFTVGLLASILFPQAYCHYGCPTGAMLKFLTASPTSWTRRDTIAGALVLCSILYIAYLNL